MVSDPHTICVFCNRYKNEGHKSCLHCGYHYYKIHESDKFGVQYPLQKPLHRVGIDMLNIMADKDATREEIEGAARTLQELIGPYL